MYYAELQTDRYIREQFFPNFSEKKTMVEVGAGPPEFYSISKHFRDHGWRCICVEPNPKFVEQHKQRNHEVYQYACSNQESVSNFHIVNTQWDQTVNGISYSSITPKYNIVDAHTTETIQVSVVKLNSLLESLNIQTVDFVSVDTEGWELEVMQGFDIFKYSPTVVLLENFVHDPKYTQYMQGVNYKLVKQIDYNYIFTKN